MKFKKKMGILIIVLFTTQMTLLFTSDTMKFSTITTTQEDSPLEDFYFMPEASPGFENIKANILKNGDFEQVDAYQAPYDFTYYGNGYQILNASYQDDVHGGSYSMYAYNLGTDQFSSNVYNYKSLTSFSHPAYLVQDISLDMWFKTKSNPDLTAGAVSYMYFYIATGGSSYFMQYYLSYNGALPGNSTNWAYFDTRQPIGSWYHLQRNLTRDFEEAFPSVTITASFYPSYVYIISNSVVNPTGPIETLIDDVSIQNSTSFEFIQNGDFELGSGQYWSNYRNGPGSIKPCTTDFTSGTQSLNLTANAYFDNSLGYIECRRNLYYYGGSVHDSFYPTAPGEIVIDMDWKYTDTLNGGSSQEAYVYLHLENATYDCYIYYYLGEESDTVPYSNSTNPSYLYRYYSAPGFGSRDNWEHLSLDVFDLVTDVNLLNGYVRRFYLTAYAGSEANSTVTLLADNLSIRADPLGDPSFEYVGTFYANDPLSSWTSSNHNYVNRTTDAHTGLYAANVSSINGVGTSYCYREAFLPVSDNLYTDFWWRLDQLSGPSNGYSTIRLQFNYNRYIHYILGVTPTASFSNSSTTIYLYDIPNQNLTGTWYNLQRNIEDDIFACFGEYGWNLTQVRLASYSSGTTSVSTIFDDINLVFDSTPPELLGLIQTPVAPEYTDAVTIEVDVIDNTGVAAVEMFYRVGTGSWVGVPMTNTGGAHYEAGIADYDYGTVIQYYIIAYDIYGLQSLLGSELAPFEYTVGDTVDPILTVEYPDILVPINSTIIFNMTGEDVGSGIASFEIFLDGESILTDVIVPAEFVWETTYLDNGNHTFIFVLEDNAGNTDTLGLEYIVDHHVPWYVRAREFLEKWWPYLTAGSGVLVVGIITLVIVVRVRKRRTAA